MAYISIAKIKGFTPLLVNENIQLWKELQKLVNIKKNNASVITKGNPFTLSVVIRQEASLIRHVQWGVVILSEDEFLKMAESA